MSEFNPEQFLAIVRANGARLVLYARQRCGNPEDVVQEALIKLHSERPAPMEPVSWLYRVVRNLSLNASRSRQRRSDHETRAADSRLWFQTDLAVSLDARTATEALQNLPEDQRETIVLRIWCDHSFQQIAELTDTSAATANRRFHTGLESLRKKLDDKDSRTIVPNCSDKQIAKTRINN